MHIAMIHRIALLAAIISMPALAPAGAVYTYDFSNLTAGVVPAANETPAPGGVSFQGTTTTGAIGPDNWIWTTPSTGSNFPAIVRNDSAAGMAGNFISSYPASAAESINSRKNDAGFSYSIPEDGTFSVSFVARVTSLVNTSGATVYSAAQVALGYDQNGDGDIRGTASGSGETAEVGPLFGFSSNTWYLRIANPSNASVTIYQTPNTLGLGTFLIQLIIDPNANPNANPATGNEGSGTLLVRKLYELDGTPVDDALQTVNPSLTNANLMLRRMRTSSNGGTAGGWDPANWNGLVTRVVNDGAIDDIAIRTLDPGDANADGVVTADDYALIDRGFASHLTGWINGDFNHDGVVDQNDYLLIDTAYSQQLGSAPADLLATRQAQFGDAYVSSLLASVPEPASAMLFIPALAMLIRRRR